MTYFMVRVAAVVGALGLVWMSSAEAESQAGGLPAVSSRVQVLEEVSKALQSQVTTLLTEAKALQTQVDTLQSDNATLQESLSKETQTRKTETTTLQEAISKETQARQTETTKLQEGLSQETHTRQTADDTLSQSAAELEAQINEQLNAAGKVFSVSVPQTFLINGHLGTVATLANVPAGRYVVIAKAVVENDIHDSGWACLLFRNAENLSSDVLDHSSATTESGSFRLTRSTVSMVAVVTLFAPGSFRMDCQTEENGSDLFGVKIVAVSVQ